MDGWNTTFLLGRPIFRCYVSFREGTNFVVIKLKQKKSLPGIAAAASIAAWRPLAFCGISSSARDTTVPNCSRVASLNAVSNEVGGCEFSWCDEWICWVGCFPDILQVFFRQEKNHV